MRDPETLEFYAREAAAYAAGARQAQARRLDAFLARLKRGARVLELGCGGGIDAAAMIAAGFDVDATDGSPAMAAQAAARLGRPARVMAFAELEAEAAYDAVWANACLLHVPRAGLADVLARVHRALGPGGVFYAGYKAGGGEGRDRFGRYYNYPDRAFLEAAYGAAGSWAALEFEAADGTGYDGIATPWLHASACKPG